MGRPKKNPEFIDKRCEMCDKVFVVKYGIRNRRRFCSRHCAVNSPVTKEKNRNGVKLAFEKKYGCHPMQTDETKHNFKTAMMNAHGVEHPAMMPNHLSKVRATKLFRYGDEKYVNVEGIRSVMLKRYGVDNINKLKLYSDKISSTKMRRHFDFFVEFCRDNKLEMLFTFDEYKGYDYVHKYKFKCLKCNHIIETTVYNVPGIYCEYCEPNRAGTLESNVFMFLQSILDKNIIIKRHDRDVLNGKELDFYIKDKNYAIEINGLYWHSDSAGGIKKYYHLNKTRSCSIHGINLIHVYENEWLYKQEIVKSILRNLLNVSVGVVKLNGRDCDVREISETIKNKFLNDNHLQGEDRTTVKLGLYSNDELVSVMTFRRTSRYDKRVDWELTRFCNKLNTRVVGGASKLFSYFLNVYKPKTIVSYCDRRYFTGNLYEMLGFKFVNFTNPGYHYIIDKYKSLKNRMSFQKHMLHKILPNFDNSVSEWENMKRHGFDRIWDCGNGKYIFTNKL